MQALQPGIADDQGELASLVASVSQGQRKGTTYSTTQRRRDGSEYPVEVRVHQGELGAQPTLVLVASDVTARRDLEAQLLHAQRMEAVGRLAGGIAHDFNNLLTVIFVSLDSLRAGAPQDSPLREEADEALTAARRAAELTQQMLSFSRRQTLKPSVIDINDTLRGCLPLLRRALQEDVELHLELASDPAFIKVDRAQLEQALVNMAVNARDAMPKGGRLVIETAPCDANNAPRDVILPAERCVVVRLRDNGEGMDEQTRAQVFEPFFTTKTHSSGTGLGLSMVYGFVQQSGGAIQVRSQRGAGATFELFFPTAPAPDAPTAAARPDDVVSARGETVLVVDDSPLVRAVAVRVLVARGYQVLEAPDGPEAIALFEQHAAQIALLLTDVVMPKLGGRELADALRSRAPTLPVLFMSGYAEDAVLRADVRELRENFIAKPFSPEQLAAAVRVALDRSHV